MELTATNLLKIPIDERGKHYHYPYTGPYEGEPQLYEILFWTEHFRIWGNNSLAVRHVCPACGGKDTEWMRNRWAICYRCLLAFETNERYIDLTIDEEMEGDNSMEYMEDG